MGRVKKKSRLVLVLTVVVCLIAGCFGGGILLANHMLNKMDRVELDKDKIEVKEEVHEKLSAYADDVINIALYGIDATDGNIGRSDAIMIATVDKANNSLKLTSIMRDSYVDIPGRGMDKINHAYAFGGPELAISTLNRNFDLNIDDFVAVNFTTLPEVIDALGGVEIEITEEEVSHIAGIYSAGVYNLTGAQALSYSRIRYAEGGDYKRTERQRTVLEKLFEGLSNISVTEIPGVLNKVLPMIQTSLSTSEIIELGTVVLKMGVHTLEQERFPLDGYSYGDMIDGIYYLVFDQEETAEQLHEYLFNNRKIWLEE
ncbi:LCP family protein [Clostridium sp.]|uniref:LCP family protein n=1 Tax=Clostridium sp. TaxID=1506 RepID=UPI0025B8C34C|nr:LCP family protein [Clostridium sp.]